jgi:hypothetical protein
MEIHSLEVHVLLTSVQALARVVNRMHVLMADANNDVKMLFVE